MCMYVRRVYCMLLTDLDRDLDTALLLLYLCP
jgi:hypothetical protein